jgi:hypothetical protein
MGRLTTIVKNLLSQDKIRFVDLLELHFSSDAGGVKLLTNAPHEIILPTGTPTLSGSRTFVSDGMWLGWGAPSETGAPIINTSTIALSASDSAGYYSNIFLNKAYIGTRAVIYRQFFDPDVSPLDDQGAPVMMWDGEMTSFNLQDTQETSTIQVTTANIFYDFDAVNCRRTNTASQSQYFPSDKGFEFATQDVKDLSWGKKV